MSVCHPAGDNLSICHPVDGSVHITQKPIIQMTQSIWQTWQKQYEVILQNILHVSLVRKECIQREPHKFDTFKQIWKDWTWRLQFSIFDIHSFAGRVIDISGWYKEAQ